MFCLRKYHFLRYTGIVFKAIVLLCHQVVRQNGIIVNMEEHRSRFLTDWRAVDGLMVVAQNEAAWGGHWL